ncbi:flagellar hook protein FlgE [Thioalkalicoccus limnaeus]|uniref:Flagellar hook protein FlgE n=1 Tax=Thioalkalicoccus limnaeus TaxID=120681 RepID=A0ABV4BHI9_9GAMM
MLMNNAISGLQAATTDLSVVSNNVANASTVGFKSSQALFADMYAANASPGKAVGMGVQVAGVSQSFNQGSLKLTNKSLDLAIVGQGFFGVNNGGAMAYTRAGAFGTDKDGFIVNQGGMRLMGYQSNGAGGVSGQLGDLRIDTAKMAPSATSRGNLSLNLDAGVEPPAEPWAGPFDPWGEDANAGPPSPDTYNSATSLTVYDSLGNPHTLSLYFVRGEGNQWEVHALIGGVTVGGSPAGTLTFDEQGVLDPESAEFELAGWQPLNGAGEPNGAAGKDMTFSLGDSTQFASPFTIQGLQQDGYATGEFSRIAIDDTGHIVSYFTNGRSQVVGQVALYNFANPQGLQPVGDSAWVETPESGVALVGAPGVGGLGRLESGALEESNVDLTEELVNLIQAQRNYQANAKTIQTADTITQTILNMR